MLTRVPTIGSRVPPIYNIIISNVPGPRGKLYFLGAEMEAYYPISALAHGQALNITVLSYAGGLYFGFTGCADKVPHLQRLAVYTGDALDELELTFCSGGAKKTGKRTAAKPVADGGAAVRTARAAKRTRSGKPTRAKAAALSRAQ